METNKLGDFKELKKLGRAGYLKCEKCEVEAWYSSKQIKSKSKCLCGKCESRQDKNSELILDYDENGLIISNESFKKTVFLDKQSGMKHSEIKKKYNVDPSVIDKIFEKRPSKPRVGKRARLWMKIYKFCDNKMNFTPQELMDKIGPSPKCYLTGDIINLEDSRSYELDHIIPKSKGGDNSLENCGVTVKIANRVKTDLVIGELIEICEKILKMHKK